MMKMLEAQVGQLVGRLSANEGKLPGQPKGPETANAIQTRSGKEIEDLKRSAGARKPKPSAEMKDFAKEEVMDIVTEEPEFEMPGEDTKIPQLKPRYFRALGLDHVKMSDQCSADIANGLEKQKDPECLTSVSVMPRDMFEKLRLPLEPTSMCLELGDNSILYPLAIAEDVPVKVGHHFIPVDFVVLEMGEMEKPPLILGRPFLKTVGATIDVGKGEVNFDINDERSSFKFRPRLEVCNMIEVKYVPPYRHVVKEEPRKKEEPKKKEVKKIIEVVASVKTKEQKPPVKNKKMTKLENKPVPKMVRKWVPKIAVPAKSVDLK
jgi:hypothetical protein